MTGVDRVDCLVVGAGPAGLTAAMYLRRFHRRVRLVDDGASRAMRIDRSRNVPGFPHGISGETLLGRLREQLVQAGGAVTDGRVESLVRVHDGFVAGTSLGALHARTVVLATGVVDREPSIGGIDEVRRRGRLRYCPICDGHEWSGRRIGIVGAGAHAEREARFVLNDSPHVTVVDPASPRVECRDDGALRVHRGGGLQPVDVDVLYAALGTVARSQLAQRLGAELDAEGALPVDAHGRTAVPGLYAAGDVVSALDQIAVATGHAAIVATDVHNGLRRHD